MIDAAVLAAIAAAVDRGGSLDRALAEIDDARGAAGTGPPPSRAPGGPGPEAEPHALRLSYLMIARAIPPRAARRDVATVEAAFAEARAEHPGPTRAFWWPSALLALALL